ncbi:hypothetical protein K1T71_011569 [Dendrolimus kikuchii]|uniref:Uncharacterized protein n=1 Tax=Dendrolimus kikuchii TaxID=765133 RepID=A0ACC1CP81_9NEOP|nr:hypothetical protein K1T71_011569 [Dendrolimus kikuchii]
MSACYPEGTCSRDAHARPCLPKATRDGRVDPDADVCASIGPRVRAYIALGVSGARGRGGGGEGLLIGRTRTRSRYKSGPRRCLLTHSSLSCRTTHTDLHRKHTASTMAAKFVLLFACVALSSAGMVRRDAPQETPLQQIQKHAEEFQKTFSEQFNALVNSKNTQEVNKALKEGSDSVLQQLSTLSNSIQKALTDANGKAKEALEQARKNLEQTAEELRKAHPDVENQANALKDKLQSAVQKTVQESQKLAKEVAANMEQTNEKLAPKLKAAYEDFVKQAEEVQKKIHEAATKQ